MKIVRFTTYFLLLLGQFTFGQEVKAPRVYDHIPTGAVGESRPDRDHNMGLDKGITRHDVQMQNLMRGRDKSHKATGTMYKPSMVAYKENGNNWRDTYVYGSNGRIAYKYTEIFENGGWRNFYRETYTYDGNGNLLIWNKEHWEAMVGFKSLDRYTYTYDINGNKLTFLWEAGDSNRERHYYTYDGSGNMITAKKDYWDDLYHQWGISYLETYTYDGSGNILAWRQQQASLQWWENKERKLFTYDEKGNMLTELWQFCVALDSVWENVSRDTFTYDGSGNMLFHLKESWSSGVWENQYRNTYSYDNNGKIVTDIQERWSSTLWLNDYRHTYTYDANGFLVTDLCDEGYYSNWNQYRKSDYMPDANGNCIFGENFSWTGAKWVAYDEGKLNIHYNENDVLMIYGKLTANIQYSVFTGIDDQSTSEMDYTLTQNYPNPFNPSTVISFEVPVKSEVTLTVFNTLGEVVQKIAHGMYEAGKHEITFNAAGLPSGVYFYRLQTGDFIQTKKMVLMR